MCVFLTTYMTITLVFRYLENRDTSSVTYQKFNQNPENKYPTFSICFTGTLDDKSIYDSFGINVEQYQAILSGEEGVFRYEYDFGKKLYKKAIMSSENISNINVEKFHLTLEDTLLALEFLTDKDSTDILYDKREQGTQSKVLPFITSYLSPNQICISRHTNDSQDLIRKYDWISLNTAILEKKEFYHVEFQILIHYPGQLLRAFDKPHFHSSFSKYNWTNGYEIQFKIAQTTVLKKRTNGNIACSDVQNHDLHTLGKLMKRIGCVPNYWKQFYNNNKKLNKCKCGHELKQAYGYVKQLDYANTSRHTTLSESIPCVDMDILTIHREKGTDTPSSFTIRFIYNQKYYLEIKNSKYFEFENFWSGIGGFIGIFLGYSMLQIPELIGHLKVDFTRMTSTKRN